MHYNRQYTIRPIEREDYHRGYLDVINLFTRPPVIPMEYEAFCERLDAMQAQRSQVFVAMAAQDAEEKERVVGTAKVLLEMKMHNHGAVMGHVEDVVVHPDYRGCGIARMLVDHCLQACREAHCYKVVLSCKEDLVSLYHKFGFRETGRAMTIYRDST